MLKTRLLLAVVVLVSLVLAASGALMMFGAVEPPFDLNGIMPGVPIVLAMIVSVFALPASIIMFVFSFFRVHETEDSRLAYDPDNFYWKIMSGSFGENWDEGISLCKAFWLTVVGLLIVGCLTFLVLGAIFIVGLFVYLSLTGQLDVRQPEPKMLAFLIGLTGTITALLILSSAFSNPKGKKRQILKYLSFSILIFSLVALPIYVAGFMEYIKGVGILVGASIGAGGAFYLLSQAFSKIASGDNLLTRFFKALKEGFCPKLVARRTA